MSIKKMDDGRYLLDIRPHGRKGKRVRKVFDKKSVAIATERYIMANAEKREYIQGYRDRRTLNDLFDLWWMYHGQHQRNAEVNKTLLHSTIRNIGAEIQAADIKKIHFMDYRSEQLQAGIKPSTINRNLVRLSGMYSALIKMGLYDGEHPLRGMGKLYEVPVEMSFLTMGEIGSLLDALDGDYWRLAVLCLNTDARFGEASGLRGEQVVNNRVTFLETKGGKRRTIPISQEVCDAIKTRDSGCLFDVDYRRFRALIKQVKPDLPPGQATHVLRHTFASHFIMNGGSIVALQRILGHATIMQTMTYAHLAPDYLADAVKLSPVAGLRLSRTETLNKTPY
ncbi:tyrosine-type recombinase/integrase [Salmonella enterica]|nr:tyrosine-type recombinase/integrase [Salmonella enterica]